MMRSDLGHGGGAGEDYREDILLSYAARYELRVLAAKIQDDDRGGFHFLVLQGFRWGASSFEARYRRVCNGTGEGH